MVTRFQALHFDGKTSRPMRVEVESDGSTIKIRRPGENGGTEAVYDLSMCVIPPPLGDGPRTIRLPGGQGVIETHQVVAVDELERLRGVNRPARLLHLMESRWRIALVALALFAALVAAAARWLIPELADRAALAVPSAVSARLSEEALEQFDSHFLHPSEIDSWRRERIKALFSEFCAKTGVDEPRLVFRSLPGLPNAFALPRGIVILTDQMVEFAASDDELLSVLAHEAAHQAESHVMRQLLRNAGVYILVSLALGDASSIVSVTATLPAMLVEKGYGREFENGADELGAALMQKSGRSVDPMIAFMERMASKYPDAPDPGLFSTHPSIAKRIERLKSIKAFGRP